MPTQLNAYLSFRDTARPAMEFYQSVFGGELVLNSFGEFGEAVSDDPAEAEKVMHGQLTTPSGMVLMGADTPADVDLTAGSNFSMSLSGDDESELRGYWDALVEGGQVVEDLAQAPWGDHFGMCVDRFGTPWMVNIAGNPA